MPGLYDDLDRVETAYRRAWSSQSDHAEQWLIAELENEGLGEEWTVRDRPSCEILLAAWRDGLSPGRAMELVRFALKARRHTS